ncbi:2-oxo-3-deoxygalactonate kinase [Alteromonas sp. KUL17]|uniref:2-dehydro-3-deoxygalactonokinase n=1 Tax=Alteromonas sp. KUL17 TaxID=2480796 RepID=UPI001037800B|nr:2-dehydro-3-deoxygalactonokinase [Alteromonas sp. KUL17]TAP29850.1 2-dehydro-3-deoxygalactonokinase [Alteromonas sp. KUL17]GEA02258.1 2-oxo-3-deoxygalactonate kinase [Alteromonas sp. KUL17]
MDNDISTFVVDWGTSNFRLFGLDSKGVLVDTIEAPMGLLQIKDGKFAEALEPKLKAMASSYQHIPVLMAGMVGSASGWKEVPYVAAPASVSDVAHSAVCFELPWGARARILPGVSYRSAELYCDVMRGEEVQVFGLPLITDSDNMHIVLPGTHSKHVDIKSGAISSFSTYFTGELFALLSHYSSVKPPLPAQEIVDENAFLKGVKRTANGALLNDIFSARALRLFGELADHEVADYLSGILIGNELHSSTHRNIYLVGGEALCARYELAAKELQIETYTFSGNTCFLNGIARIIKEIENEQ